jgi:hypothetical protein
MAKYSWCKENCGDRAIVITEFDLYAAIQEECAKYVFGSEEYGHDKDYFGDWLEQIKKEGINQFSSTMFARLANGIIRRVSDQKLSAPFTGIDEKLIPYFWRYENGESVKQE